MADSNDNCSRPQTLPNVGPSHEDRLAGSRMRTTRMQRRNYYRTVFEETANHAWTLMKLSDFLLVLRDFMKFLYECGWVHRNIRVGNTHLHEPRGLFGDLQYAKIMGSGVTHEMRTGSLDFMAFEVLWNGYAFLPLEDERTDEIEKLIVQDIRTTQGTISQGPRSPLFRRNVAHDLESLWWLALFILFFNRDTLSPETDDQMYQRKTWSKLIFPKRTACFDNRQKFFRGISAYEEGVSWFPQPFHKLRDMLGLMRRLLVAHHGKFEKAFPDEHYEVFDGLHDAIIEGFDFCTNDAGEIQLLPLKEKVKKESQQDPDVPAARRPEDGQEDHTTNVMVRGHVPPVRSGLPLIPDRPEEKKDWGSKKLMMTFDNDVDKKERIATYTPLVRNRKIQRRINYQILFAEIAEPIWTLAKLSDVSFLLTDCARNLKHLNKYNIVHRNINAGNVYRPNCSLIGDLEYTELVRPDDAHEMRMGSMNFTPLEVLLKGYAFLPFNIEEVKFIEEQLAAKNVMPVVPFRGVEAPPFRHNAAHDLESLWWLALFVLFSDSDVSNPETDVQRTQQKECRKLIFPENLSDFEGRREMFLRNETQFHKVVAWLPSSFENLKGILSAMRAVLIADYSKFEAAFPKEDHGVFDRLHDAFVGAFNICKDQSSGINLSSVKATAKQQEEMRQRPVTEETIHDEPDQSETNQSTDKRGTNPTT